MIITKEWWVFFFEKRLMPIPFQETKPVHSWISLQPKAKREDPGRLVLLEFKRQALKNQDTMKPLLSTDLYRIKNLRLWTGLPTFFRWSSTDRHWKIKIQWSQNKRNLALLRWSFLAGEPPTFFFSMSCRHVCSWVRFLAWGHKAFFCCTGSSCSQPTGFLGEQTSP